MTADILDISIIVLIVLSAVIGLIRGFVREAFSLITWLAALGFAFLYYEQLAVHVPFDGQGKLGQVVIAFIVIFLGVLIVGSIINHLLSAAVSSVGLGGVDYLLGGAFGILRGGLIVTLLVLLFSAVGKYSAADWWKESRLMPWFEHNAVMLKEMIPNKLPEELPGIFSSKP
ncbi:CvpA family protein [Thiothrix subterranea]|uniref:CvpA family protein n=1 Tax=Thiothrix subterranea TaxID=2735563 RepID=A0AA51MMM7_9GAMM|nr:CvpA family protein [Thiothrix subterranea]MDQ5768815.1 CvpA family protein [Thiothrix subterranea]QQZ28061.1 CvpA family protein [Thiothrix subterranea]WML86504.1 CvpA family protein [Thiothrix subterranea]